MITTTANQHHSVLLPQRCSCFFSSSLNAYGGKRGRIYNADVHVCLTRKMRDDRFPLCFKVAVRHALCFDHNACVCAAISSLIVEIILNASRMWPSYFLFSVLICVLCVWKCSLALCFHKIESEKRATQHRLRASQCKTDSSDSFILFQYPLLSDLGVTGGQLESLPAAIWRRQGDTPDKLPLRCPVEKINHLHSRAS